MFTNLGTAQITFATRRSPASSNENCGTSLGQMPSDPLRLFMSSMREEHVLIPDRAEIEAVIAIIARHARTYLTSVDDRPARSPRAEEVAQRLGGPLPEAGCGASSALHELLDKGLDAAARSAGPRVFHFVIGDATPAALGGDWLAGMLDQMAYAWVASPLATRLEDVSLGWLRTLFELDDAFQGVMTTGATMANFVGLGAARQWWAERHGIDVAERGFTGLPRVPVFSSGYVHASVIKSLAMLGIGRAPTAYVHAG